MTPTDLTALSPLIVISSAAVVVMLLSAFYRHHATVAIVTILGLAIAFFVLPAAATVAPRQVTRLVIIDAYALFYMGLVLAAAIAVAMLAYDYLKARASRPEEFYILLLVATTGCLALVCSNHFASFFLGLEILSVSLYTLIAYRRSSLVGLEAGIKYLVLAGASSAFLLFGMALVYAVTGTLSFSRVKLAEVADPGLKLVLPAGLVLMLVGVGFKLAVVPFHLWTPDVYQGAAAPTAAFVATISKGAMVAVVLRFFRGLQLDPASPVYTILAIVALLSMFWGNLLALLQRNVKRMLAGSSIAHLGYLLVAFLAGGAWAPAAVGFYLTAYFITMLGAFGVVSVLSPRDRDADLLDDYRGLAWHSPWLAAVFSAMLLSLAGIPLTIGFIGKFYLLTAGVAGNRWWLTVSLVVSSVIGLYYYLRVMITMYARPALEDGLPSLAALGADASKTLSVSHAVLLALGVLLVWLGVYPGPLVQIVEQMMAALE